MESLRERLKAAVAYIAQHQRADGIIPSHQEGLMDPWDMVECAMALDVGGLHERAKKAYLWLQEVQNEDGSFWSYYEEGVPVDFTRDTNMSTYVALGSWHHYLLTRDRRFLERMWPTVARAVEFAFALQGEEGLIYWASDRLGRVWPDSLVAGTSSVRAAILCAERIAAVLGKPHHQRWREGRRRLERAFVTWEGKMGRTLPEDESCFAMHWYYPVLCGLVRGSAARQRLVSRWRQFVHPRLGVRCRVDRPWVTVAESCELAMALDVVGARSLGRRILGWQLAWQDEDGGFRIGTVPTDGPWPDGQRPTWTAAAVVLAMDCLYDLTPGGLLFRSLHEG
jgi:hypothetical protein